ncbi:MAG: cadherin-like domain-containing protein, partial [Clostridia bacterium]|nr:cadherin-like domain-containing protein [Clostridia bacterium]
MKKIGFFGLLTFWLLCLGVTVNGAVLSPAISVMQDDFEMIKTGVGVNTVSFGEDDFKELLGDSDFTGIKLQALPEASDGILKLGTKTLAPGDVIERDMLAALRFIPAEEGKTAVFSFLPQGTEYEKPFLCTVYMLDTLNFAPVAKASVLTAKENIPVYASLNASDPDGDEIVYHLAEEPKNGTLTLSEDGNVLYTAYANGVGTDRFSYYVSDRYGNRSDPVFVSVTTTANASGIVYADLQNSKYALPAAVLAEKGAFVGEKLGEEWNFYPEKTVTRADFLMMAMQMCDIDTALLASNQSNFADRAEFTATQNRYIAAAARMGLVIGLDTDEGRCFCPNEAITSEQASTLLGRIAQYKKLSFGDAVAASIDEDGVISDEGLALLASVGLFADGERKAVLTRASA